MTGLRHLIAIALICVAATATAAPLTVNWSRAKQVSGKWVLDEHVAVPDAEGSVTFLRGSQFFSRLSTELDADLSATPCLEINARTANAQWRLGAQAGDGPEIIVADSQLAGVCRRNLAERLGVTGRTTLALHMYIWGWAGTPDHGMTFIPELKSACEETDAAIITEEISAMDRQARATAEDITLVSPGHPCLRFTDDQREMWRERAVTTHAPYNTTINAIIENIEQHKAEEPYVLTAETMKTKRPVYGAYLLSVRPPEAPTLAPGEGRDPFSGLRTEGCWRQLCWHDFSVWLIGDATSDEPAFAEQARRWTVELAKWRFWLDPGFRYFDFGCAYPLQCLCMGYDIAEPGMAEEERELVREAISTMAHGLYLNTITGHGSIYNDLRGNHTAVTMCGLGLAGLTLLGERDEAPQWVALAEQFLVNMFAANPTGAWLESPSYGAYGVCEWMKLAEMMRKVTGIDHVGDPFFHKFGRYQIDIADWTGMDLGYNGGGAGQAWNQWVFHAIAREFQDPEIQWLAHPGPDEAVSYGYGYGDLIWWVDPELEGRRPTDTNTGRTFEDIGVSVWRSGWDDEATILLHHCGIKGQHKEENMNQVTLYALGERLLPDGIGGKTWQHNVLMIDEAIQNRWMAGATLAYHCDERAGYSLGDAQSAYRGWRRHVLFLRPDLVALVDEVDLGETKDREVDFLLHPNGETSVADGVITVTSGAANLQACTVLEDGTVLPVTCEEIESKRATHQCAAHYTGRGSLRAVTFLVISRADELGPLSVEATDAGLRLTAGEREWALDLTDVPVFVP